jgi:hypothetical protein
VLWVCGVVALAVSYPMGRWLSRVGEVGAAGPWQVVFVFVVPMTTCSLLVTGVYVGDMAWLTTVGAKVRLLVAVVFALATGFMTYSSIAPRTRRLTKVGVILLSAIQCGWMAAVISELLARLSENLSRNDAVVIMPAIIIAGAGLVTMFMIGLVGREMSDARREWWSRVGAQFAVVAILWAGLGAIAINVPNWASSMGAKSLWAAAMSWGATALGAYKLATGMASHSEKSREDSNSWLALVGTLAGAVFILAMLCGVSILNHHLLAAVGYHSGEPFGLIVMIGVLASMLLLFSYRFDVNEFSLNHFYRNRLVRCYMGAAREHRTADRFTGLDFGDDFDIHNLVPGERHRGPYHIVCTSLNLAQSTDLAVQDRRADSFIVSPLYCGSVRTGYRKSRGYIYNDRERSITLGTAIAISGAAASPNMGHFTSPVLAFLMTVFNVRLGWWVPHPDRTLRSASPPFSLDYMLRELLAATTDHDDYLYLSDGGHFENLGAYELIRRRCRLVIVGDGECDADTTFGALGTLIRICRLDFNVDIQIDPAQIADRNGGRFGKTHCAVGKIVYPDAPQGTLLYLKASLTGDEDTDVLQYAASSATFPHETTADQFFSEEQFESYRKLGEHVAEHALSTAVADWKSAEPNWERVADNRQYLSPLLLALHRVWFAPSKSAGNFMRLSGELTKIWEIIRNNRHLGFLDAQIFPQWHDLTRGASVQPRLNHWLPSNERELREAFYVCQSLIQLMENVYLDLDLEREGTHPDNRGWLNLFRHWTGSGMMRVAWALSCPTYGARFQSWVRRTLGMDNTDGFHFERPLPGRECNQVELDILAREMEARPAMRDSQMVGISVRVKSVLGGREFRFRVGLMAVTEAEGVVCVHWIRIQEQLRSMGLGRAALQSFGDEIARANGRLEMGDVDSDWLKKQDRARQVGSDWMRRVLTESTAPKPPASKGTAAGQ